MRGILRLFLGDFFAGLKGKANKTGGFALGFFGAAVGGAGPEVVAGAGDFGGEVFHPLVAVGFHADGLPGVERAGANAVALEAAAFVTGLFHFKTHQATPWSLVQSP